MKPRFTSVYGLLKREMLRYLSSPLESIFNYVFLNTIYFVSFSTIHSEPSARIVFGSIAIGSLQAVLGNVRMTVFVGRMDRSIWYQLMAPIPWAWISMIVAVAAAMRGMLVAALSVAVIWLLKPGPFALLTAQQWVLVVGALALLYFMTAFIGIILSLTYKDWNSYGVWDFYLITPALFFNGLLFPISTDSLIGKMVYLNPFYYPSQLLAAVVNHHYETIPALFGVALILSVSGVWVSSRLFARGYNLAT